MLNEKHHEDRIKVLVGVFIRHSAFRIPHCGCYAQV